MHVRPVSKIIGAALLGIGLLGVIAAKEPAQATQAPGSAEGIAVNTSTTASDLSNRMAAQRLPADIGFADARTSDEAQGAFEVAQRWRRGRGRGYRRHRRNSTRNIGRGVAIGVGAAVLGAIIINEAAKRRSRDRSYAYEGNSYMARKRRCARDYKSFDWQTETYITYGGVEKVCPYLY